MAAVSVNKRVIQSIHCGTMIGFIGAGGGMMMLMILTMILGVAILAVEHLVK